MTTFKNNAKYAELLFLYLDIANRDECPIQVPDVLRHFTWHFKGGSLREAAKGTRLEPETSSDYFPDGSAEAIASEWPEGRQALALRLLLRRRALGFRIKSRGYLSRIGTYQLLTSQYGDPQAQVKVCTGMQAIYHVLRLLWIWSEKASGDADWENMLRYIKEAVLCSAAVSRVHVPSADAARQLFCRLANESHIPALLQSVMQLKELIRMMNGPAARNIARAGGMEERSKWDLCLVDKPTLSDPGELLSALRCRVGPLLFHVSQGVALLGKGAKRWALGKSDAERLHQVVMSTASCLVGVCSQAAVGTQKQKVFAKRAVEVTKRNIWRLVESSTKVPLGEEVLVCKGYRRAYTAHLGRLAGKLCHEEYLGLVKEAEETASPGVLDIEGFLHDARTLDAASSLNASKVFKVCPAPDVSPGAAMMDRVKQIGNGNIMSSDIKEAFETELKSQILRAYIRAKKGRLKLRDEGRMPLWFPDYLRGDFNLVPSRDIDEYLAWEGDAVMPDMSEYDPKNWKDSGLGADTVREAMHLQGLGHKSNMVTRLIFDDDCPMPGRRVLSDEHVIKFFTKAEGHKDPARGIFSANLTDRQAQSWMERAVDKVAREHPSYMIGQEVDVKNARVAQLTSPPEDPRWVALYYSFDISGWSAKMPAEPQRISHSIWGKLYDEVLFRRATEINENAYIYLNMDGYIGWYRNTHSNLEGFNGKEMTMILVALLSLSVRRWREKVVEAGVMGEQEANKVNALLFAYIDDGLSRIDLPKKIALAAFTVYRDTVIETFQKCGFSVEVTKCFPSDTFAIFLNEVYIAGRHVVHGVRAAMAISSEPTERHTTLVERVTSVATGCRGATMAGLNALSSTILMAYHTYLHLSEWVREKDPVVLTGWTFAPRTWGGLGLPNMMQLFTSGSGSAFEEGIATLQIYASINPSIKQAYLNLARIDLDDRDAVGVLTSPLSGKVVDGYMVDSRVAVMVRRALKRRVSDGLVSRYAERLLKYADEESFREYAQIIVPLGTSEVLQEQMLTNMADAHPHSVFSAFARRLEKSMTLVSIVGREAFEAMIKESRTEAQRSSEIFRSRLTYGKRATVVDE